MCIKKNYKKTSNTRIDKCIKDLIKSLNKAGLRTYASCCGHNKYPMTIIMKDVLFYDFISGAVILRKRNFYKKDKQGYYYIPEVMELTKEKEC